MKAFAEQTADIRTIKVAKAAIVNHAGRLLILQRNLADSYRPGGADFPGGEIEPGETPEQTVVRETNEETGIDLGGRALRLVGTFIKNVDEPDGAKRIESTLYITTVDDNPTVLLTHDGEHTDFDWLPPADVKAAGLLTASLSKMVCLQSVLDLQQQRLLPPVD